MTHIQRREIPKGTTDVSLDVYLDSYGSDAGYGGASYTSIGTVYYHRPGSSVSSFSAASLMSATDSHSDGGWIELDATNTVGLYRLDLPDAVCADGVDFVTVRIKEGSSTWDATQIDIELIDSAGGIDKWFDAALTDSDMVDGSPIRALFYHVGLSDNTGTATTTIKLDSTASATDDTYNQLEIVLTGGTGEGQRTQITDYVGSTKVATVFPTWATVPDTTTTYAVMQHNYLRSSDGYVDANVEKWNNNAIVLPLETGVPMARLTTAGENAIADAILSRSVSNTEDTAGENTLTHLILASFRLDTFTANTLTTYKLDGVTTFATNTITVDGTTGEITSIFT